MTTYNGIIARTHEKKRRLQRQELLQEVCGKRILQLLCSLREKREREREGEKGGQREGGKEGEREREGGGGREINSITVWTYQ